MYKFANGWTKAKVMEQIRKYNNGSPALEEGTKTCIYQTSDGNRCVIGCFIPNGHPAMISALPAESLLYTFPDLIGYMPFSERAAMIEFQNTHDDCASEGLRNKPGITYTVIQKWLDSQTEE